MKNHRAAFIESIPVIAFLIALAAPVFGGQSAMENSFARLVLNENGRVAEFGCRIGNTNFLADESDLAFMSVQVASRWCRAETLIVSGTQDERDIQVGFGKMALTAKVKVRIRNDYFEGEAVSLEGDDAGKVEKWRFVNLPVNLTANAGSWLNVASDKKYAVAVIALEDGTDACGSPVLQAVAHRGLGYAGRKAAIIACPVPRLLPVIEKIEREHHLPSPTLRGEWAKTSGEARKSWMITVLVANDRMPAYTAERVFGVAKELGVDSVVISLGCWNQSFGNYVINTNFFPGGVASLKAVADQAHARGLKLGLHVMTASITKNDPLVTPIPDPGLCHDGEVTLAADVTAEEKNIPARESAAGFGTATGYWAYGGVDVQVDNEIIRYGGIGENSATLTNCVRGAYGTVAAPHKAGAKVRHITERYGWYVANPELSARIGRNLADLINACGLDMICFDGADVSADATTQFYRGHQVAKSLLAHVQRDVLLISNGSTHFGWHCMARGGEDDAMARGYKGWVDDHTVHAWGALHIKNFIMPDFSWVGIYPHTPTLTAARPDDVELVCARSLGYDAPIGWGFAACYGGAPAREADKRQGAPGGGWPGTLTP